MSKASLDSNKWKKGIADALQIKGTQEAPNHVNTDQVQVIVDSLQGGFSVYETLGFDQNSEAINGVSSKLFNLFSPFPAEYSYDNIRNNQAHEIRLLGIQTVFNNIGASAGDRIYVELFLQSSWGSKLGQTHGNSVKIVQMEQPQIGGESQYIFTFPALTNIKDSSQGSDENFSIPQTAWNWHGWIPAGSRLDINVGRDGGSFGEDDIASFKVVFARVPKGVQLPM